MSRKRSTPPSKSPPTPSTADATLHLGDCISVMAAMEEASVDAIVADPPYGLEFMGREWDSFRIAGGSKLPAFGKRRTTGLCRACGKRDAFRNPHKCGDAADWVTIPVDASPMEMRAYQNWCAMWAVEAERVLKPGGHLLAFGGTRTYHRLACALEEAGFEIRDSLAWIYGSGFPKSLDVSKSIDTRAGAEREVVGKGENWGASKLEEGKVGYGDYAGDWDVTAPATDEATKWDGWGTALKPAHEPVVLARKLLAENTVAGNVLEHGTGALNIKGCVLPASGGSPSVQRRASHAKRGEGVHPRPQGVTYSSGGDPDVSTEHYLRERSNEQLGRWPANVALGHHPDCQGSGAKHTDVLCVEGCPVAELNRQSGHSVTPDEVTRGASRPDHIFQHVKEQVRVRAQGDEGGAARFFYIAKAKKRERVGGTMRNLHPTVKPVELMRWLVRLVTPPGGVVLDPFLGSGSTGCAAMAEGFRFVGIEQDPESYETALARVADWAFVYGRTRPLDLRA